MNKSISIIIIGYNTAADLKNLLCSINRLRPVQYNVEVIYIDDGSTDESVKVFEASNLNFSKLCYKFDKNRGRIFARNKGIQLASGTWFLFLSSNIEVEPELLNEYLNATKISNALAFMGKIKYTSPDSSFQWYLNHRRRGINQLKNLELCNYRFLLFSNCLMHHSIFKKIEFNTCFVDYGGEELEFAHRFNQLYPNKIRACSAAIATRINHPGLLQHSERLEVFGKTNFRLLNQRLKVKIIRYKFLLSSAFCYNIILNIVKMLNIIYFFKIKSYYMIRLIMLGSLLKGYFTYQKTQNHQTEDPQ